MLTLCSIFSPRKQSPLCTILCFSRLINTSVQSELAIKDEDNINSILDSLHKGLNWKLLSQKFISVKFTIPIVETVLLRLSDPINSRKALNFFHWSAKEMNLQHGIPTYCITIHTLVKARLSKDAKALLESVLIRKDCRSSYDQAFVVLHSLIGSYEVIDSVPYVFDFYIQTCAKLRMTDIFLDACKLLFDHGFSLSLPSFNILLHVTQKSIVSHLVWSVYEQMLHANVYPNEVTLRIMVSALCKEGNLEKVVDIVARMHGKRCSVPGIIVNTYFLYKMIEEEKIEDALVLLKQLLKKNMLLDTVSYSLIILAKVKMDNLDAAKDIHEEMLKRGFEKNSFVCCVFIGKYCKEGRMDEAIELLEEMEMLSFRPLNETYNQLIEGCSATGRLEDSLRFCKQMIESRLLPSCSTVNKMFQKLCENGNCKQADEMLTIFLSNGFTPDKNTYSLLIDGYCKAGDPEGALKLLFEMQYRAISPNRLGYSSLIVILCKFGRLKEAEKYLKMMKAQSFVPSPSVYESLIVGHLHKGDKIKARQLTYEIYEN